jgi:tripartite-type tricarboxylate transporter receptor subunit TctC
MQATKRLITCLLLGTAALLPLHATAQEAYPSHPIRLLVGFQPGSASDVGARISAQKMSQLLGQSIIVDNRPGASSNIATKAVATAPPDGYTLFFCTVANVINTAAKGAAVVDIGREMGSVGMIGGVPNILVLNPSLNVDTLPALIALLKSKPGQISYGTAGVGSSLHMAAELFSFMAGVKMLHVPYQGSSAAVTDLLGGQTQLMFAPTSTVLSYVKAGRLKALASTGSRRTAAAPELPTLDELGLKGFESSVWYGIVAPPGMPPKVTAALEAAIAATVAAPEVQAQFKAQGIEGNALNAKDFNAYIHSETEKWAKVIQVSGIKLE